jgi:hypothetical protein
MNRNSKILGAAFATLAVAALAFAPANAETQHDTAIDACAMVNPFQPVDVLNAVEDGSGVGFSLVWLEDGEGNLWMCDADSEGYVYSYSLVTDDLLGGAGPEMIGLQLASDGSIDEHPQTVAEKICVAYLDGGSVIASQPDGLDIDPGYIVFVEDTAGSLYLCDATGDAMVWAFEPIGEPLVLDDQEIS